MEASPSAAHSGAGPARFLRILCFAVLGGLAARRVAPDLVLVAGGAVAGVLFQWLGLTLMALLIWVSNPGVRRQHGYGAIRIAIARGFLLLVPFTVLGAAADLGLGWNAVQAFTSAGLMTAAAAAGMEVGRLGGGRLRSALLPAGWAFLLSALWMVMSSMAQVLGRTSA